MRLFFCIAGLSAGGGERQFLRLAQGLMEAGHTLFLHIFGNHESVHYREIYSLPAEVFFSGVRRGVRLRAPWIILCDLHEQVRRFQPDLIFATLMKASHAVRIARLLGLVHCPIVTSLRTDYLKHYSPLMKLLERFLSRYNDAWITNHRPSYEHFSKILGSRARYIPNGISEADLDPGTVERDLESRKRLRLLSIGQMNVDYKNQLALIDAMGILQREHPELSLELLLIGKGRDETRIRQRIQLQGLQNSIEVLPPVTNVAAHCRAADVFLHPAILEGCPNVLLEAMLCGTPVVVSQYVGALGIVEDGVTGIVASGNDARSLANAILRFTNLPLEERRSLGTRARAYIQTYFSTSAMVEAHLRLFEEIVERPSGHAK